MNYEEYLERLEVWSATISEAFKNLVPVHSEMDKEIGDPKLEDMIRGEARGQLDMALTSLRLANKAVGSAAVYCKEQIKPEPPDPEPIIPELEIVGDYPVIVDWVVHTMDLQKAEDRGLLGGFCEFVTPLGQIVPVGVREDGVAWFYILAGVGARGLIRPAPVNRVPPYVMHPGVATADRWPEVVSHRVTSQQIGEPLLLAGVLDRRSKGVDLGEYGSLVMRCDIYSLDPVVEFWVTTYDLKEDVLLQWPTGCSVHITEGRAKQVESRTIQVMAGDEEYTHIRVAYGCEASDPITQSLIASAAFNAPRAVKL